jgi:hypothetical protein
MAPASTGIHHAAIVDTLDPFDMPEPASTELNNSNAK